jgi:outer membrane protein assembly factor BamB
MSTEVTYLELSQESGSAHKFYEVTVEDTEVKIRYGRIGETGRIDLKSFPTAEKAQAEAQKKIKEKMKKGYEKALMGVRKKRPISRRAVTSTASKIKSKAPLLWQFKSGSSAFGIFIDENSAWVGNQKGLVYKLNHEGEILNQFQLPEGVKCLVGDDIWLYAGCDDGNVYDLTGKIPRLAYTIDENIDIYWLDIDDGILAVSDVNGAVVKINPEEELEWTRLSQGSSGWMVRIDSQNIYHGHSGGITCYDLEEGRNIWHQDVTYILFGWQEENSVYGGTAGKKVYKLSKQGEIQAEYQCNASVYSCATSPQGEYVFAGDSSSSLYCFSADGNLVWKFATGCGSALSMQYYQDRLYIVTTDGSFACLDVSVKAIADAKVGQLPQTMNIQAPSKTPINTASTELERTSNSSQGIILECIEEGGKLRMRVISEGFNQDWNVQFPKNIRQKGGKYVVDEVKESSKGGFYRVYGEIKKLI